MSLRWKKISLLTLITVMALFYQNCALVANPAAGSAASSAATDSATSGTLEQKAMGILAAKCMSCHNTGNQQGYLDVTNLNSMLYYRHVVPGEPNLSNIFYEISQGLMPPDQKSALTSAEVAVLSDWITNGFKNGVPTITPPSGPALTPTYPSIKAQIFLVSCNGCHSGANPRGGVGLDTYDNTIKNVVPGNSAGSRLYKALTGNGATLMPPGGGMSAKQKDAVRTWIDNGALAN